MQCPVCPRRNIPESDDLCPNCGVDLTPLKRVGEVGLAEFNAAVQLARAGTLDAAINHAAAAAAMEPHYLPAHTLLGKLLWKKGYRPEALTHWQEALSRFPDRPELQDLVGEAGRQIRRGRLTRSLMAGAAFLVLVAVATAAVLFSTWAGNRRLQEASVQFQGEILGLRHDLEKISATFTGYRSTHSYSNDDVDQVQAEATHWQKRTETALSRQKQLDRQIEKLSLLSEKLREQQSQTEAKLVQALLAKGRAEAAARADQRALSAERARITHAVNEMLNRIRSAGSPQLAAEMAKIADQLNGPAPKESASAGGRQPENEPKPPGRQ